LAASSSDLVGSNHQNFSQSSFSNRNSYSTGQHEYEAWEDADQRNNDTLPGQVSAKSSTAVKRNCLQIPCFIDDCCGKDNYMSELM
jgi:hypothetical protein